MSRRVGILVLNRLEALRQAKKSGALARRVAPRELTHESVFRHYRGFDGVVWPQLEHPHFQTEDGLASTDDSAAVDLYVSELPAGDEYDVIVLARLEVNQATLGENGWHLAGFDVGYFDSEWSLFSVVLNEIVYGLCPDLRHFTTVLNEHLLIPTLEQAFEIVKERERVEAMGADLERAEHIEPIGIFIR